MKTICVILLGLALICCVFDMAFVYAQQTNLTPDEIMKIELEKKQLELQNNTSNFQLILGVLTVPAGAFTALWGYLKYRRDEFLKKQAVFFELVKEYDDSEKMYIAKRILDGFEFTFDEDEWVFMYEHDGNFSRKNMATILRDKKTSETPLSNGEIIIRESFDNLYNFFYKLYYLEKTKMLSTSELDYFKYFIKQSFKVDACMEFAKYSSEWMTMFRHFEELGYGKNTKAL